MPDPLDLWTLHHTPSRHYKCRLASAKKASWSIDKTRIVSVTKVLGGADGLAAWSAAQATAAAQQVAVDWLGAGPSLAGSLLSFGELCALDPAWPDNVRDRAAAEGHVAHAYLRDRLLGVPAEPAYGLPYGLRLAIDDFMEEIAVSPVWDEQGARVERAVGDTERAVAGTYDAQVYFVDASTGAISPRHRLDLKTTRTVKPAHFAQLAAYERCATMCGEEASDYLTILHADRLGGYSLHSIAVGTQEHRTALGMFDASLAIHRSGPVLAKLLNSGAQHA